MRIRPGPDSGPRVPVAVAAEIAECQEVVQLGELAQISRATLLGRHCGPVGVNAAGEGLFVEAAVGHGGGDEQSG